MRKDIQGINAAWSRVIRESYGNDFPEDSDLDKPLNELKYRLHNGSVDAETFNDLSHRIFKAKGYTDSDLENMNYTDAFEKLEPMLGFRLDSDGDSVFIDESE